jgi:hypothetical protein
MAHPWSVRHRYMKCLFCGQNKTTPQGGFIQNQEQPIQPIDISRNIE